jgi:hypothetical protein
MLPALNVSALYGKESIKIVALERHLSISVVVFVMTQTLEDYLYQKAKKDYRVQRVGDI